MAAEPPPEPTPPPPPPGNASREEWRAWRRAQRYQYGYGWGSGGGWTWFWGVGLIIAGGYYLLKNLGLLEWVKGDILWPVLVIALGVWLLVGRALRHPPWS